MHLVAIGVSECDSEGINEHTIPCLGKNPLKLGGRGGREGGEGGEGEEGGRGGEGREGGREGESE